MPHTTPKMNPNALLSRAVRNKLPWPQSCISKKARITNRLIGKVTAAVSQ